MQLNQKNLKKVSKNLQDKKISEIVFEEEHQ